MDTIQNEEEIILEEIELPPYKSLEFFYRNLQNKKRSWAPIGNCWDSDPGYMYPRSHNQELEQASKVCLKCPVIKDCLFLALVKKEEYGVWGGHSSRQIQSAVKCIEESFGNIWIQWNEKSESIVRDEVDSMYNEYLKNNNIDHETILDIRRKRSKNLHDLLNESRL